MQILKKGVKTLLEKSFPAVARVTNTILPPVIVLAYHRVANLPHDSQMLAVSPTNFAAQLEWIVEKNFELVRFDDPWALYTSKIRVCITFDDGYADNILTALPILEQYNIPATFFISTYPVATGNAYWWDLLEGLLYEDLPSNPPPLPFRAAWPDMREKLYLAWHSIFRKAPPSQREPLMNSFCAWLGTSRKAQEIHRPMSPQEVTRMAQHPLATVGAHTHTHSRLAALPAAEQRAEIAQSLELLAEWTGMRPTVFAYPYGSRGLLGRGGDFSRESMRICEGLRLFRAAANYPSQTRPWTHPYAVPRHLVRDWNKEQFAEQYNTFLTSGYF